MFEYGGIKEKKKAEAQNLEFDMNLPQDPVREDPFIGSLVSLLKKLTGQLPSKKASGTKNEKKNRGPDTRVRIPS